ncbi:hypothetical protein JTB14_030006 [Gonioctena quinquepunctata]|nr:hypothetical protein JTB14_030006 [Gonioctena quinquepunctata]
MAWQVEFCQYTKGKTSIKLYILCEPNGVSLKIIVYSGSADPQLFGTGHTEKVVISLLQEKLGIGHFIFMNNYYNSVKYANRLLDKRTSVTGTLRKKRKDIPPEVVDKILKKGELVMQFNENGICVLKWKD